MTKKVIISLALVLFSLLWSVAIATAQDSTSPLIALSSTEINFYGKEGILPSSKNITVVGLLDSVDVKLVASNLYVNDSGESIAIKLNDSAPISVYSLHLSKNEEQSVEISLASEEKAGIYKGTIMVTSTDTATGNITTTNITVVATIIYVNPWLSIGQWGIVVLIGFLIFLGLIAPEKKEFLYKKHKFILEKKILVTGLGIIVSFIWLVSLVYFDFGGPSTVFAALLVAPFATYAIAIVKDRRTERLEKEKVSRTIRDDGIKKDIELIIKLIGEMATHCASFNPTFYEQKMNAPFETPLHLLYNKTGLIDTKVWGESCRQGFVADIHTLHLENYYDLIPFYNQCYAHAITLVEEKKYNTEKTTFFEPFEKLRKTYSDLQEVLFVYLSYILDLYSKTALSPMKFEFPRITRTLLYKLIEYEILKPFKFISAPDKLSKFKTEDLVRELGKEDVDNELKNLQKQKALVVSVEEEQELDGQIDLMTQLEKALPEKKERKKELIARSRKQFQWKIDLKEEFKKDNPHLNRDKNKFKIEFLKYAKEKINEKRLKEEKEEFQIVHPELGEDTEPFENEFKQYTIEKIPENEFEILEAVELWVTMKFKEKIEWWELTANDLDSIVNCIYAADEIPHFFRHMQDDFQETYLKLKTRIIALDPDKIPKYTKDSEIKEYKISLGNIYKKVEQKEGAKDMLAPDPLKLDLKAAGDVEIKEKKIKSHNSERLANHASADYKG